MHVEFTFRIDKMALTSVDEVTVSNISCTLKKSVNLK